MQVICHNLRLFSQFLIFLDHVSGPDIQATGGAGVDSSPTQQGEL